jgi:hypothetical protein
MNEHEIVRIKRKKSAVMKRIEVEEPLSFHFLILELKRAGNGITKLTFQLTKASVTPPRLVAIRKRGNT